MRAIKTKIGGKPFTLKATWDASTELAEDICDPIRIAAEAGLESFFLGQGMPYRPKWEMTSQNVPHILWIGAKAGGSDITLEAMQECVFDHGLLACKEIAGDYIALLVRKPGEQGEAKSEPPEK